jgi:Na+/H+-translocating membrane pyrophosphatase
MAIDLLQLGTNLVVGAVSAWVAGTFGVRHGLQRAQRERAFERRLTWYEDAIRVTFRFKATVDLIVIALKEPDVNKSLQILESVVKNSEEVTQNLAVTIN